MVSTLIEGKESKSKEEPSENVEREKVSQEKLVEEARLGIQHCLDLQEEKIVE
jgi:hypothetical protein